jgi:O-antigen/teichoic acid export membrane protein
VVTLSAGTLVARLLVIAAFPILTRLYTPDDFGLMSAFVAIVLLGHSLGTLTYDWAIPLSADDHTARHLLLVSLLVALVSTALFAIGLAMFDVTLQRVTRTEALGGLLLLLAPLAAFFESAARSFHFWNVRRKTFGRTLIARVGRTVTMVVAQIAAGLAGLGAVGLAVGDFLGRLVGALLIAIPALREDGLVSGGLRWKAARRAAIEYRRFPLFTGGSSVITALSRQTPTLVLIATFGPSVAGWMAASQRLVSLPAELVGRSVGDVFLADAAHLARTDPSELRRRFWAITRGACWAAFPFAAVAALSPLLFGWIFGAQWAQAGVYVAWLALPYFAQFVVWTTSNLPAYGRNGWQLVWDSARLIVSVGAILVGRALGWDAVATIALLGGGWTVLFVLLLGLNARAISWLVARGPEVSEAASRSDAT